MNRPTTMKHAVRAGFLFILGAFLLLAGALLPRTPEIGYVAKFFVVACGMAMMTAAIVASEDL